jgi:hypothetical protein
MQLEHKQTGTPVIMIMMTKKMLQTEIKFKETGTTNRNESDRHGSSITITVTWTHHSINDDRHCNGEHEEWYSQLIEQCKAREDIFRCQ